jgi:hypothetical protein
VLNALWVILAAAAGAAFMLIVRHAARRPR